MTLKHIKDLQTLFACLTGTKWIVGHASSGVLYKQNTSLDFDFSCRYTCMIYITMKRTLLASYTINVMSKCARNVDSVSDIYYCSSFDYVMIHKHIENHNISLSNTMYLEKKFSFYKCVLWNLDLTRIIMRVL